MWIETEFVKRNPVLKTVRRNGAIYRFVAYDPFATAADGSPADVMMKITQRSAPSESVFGNVAGIELYAEIVGGVEDVRMMFESAAGKSEEPAEITQLVEGLMTTGYELTCEFINVLRRSHGQYWLVVPHTGSLGWGAVGYYSRPRNKWYSIVLSDEFRSRFAMRPDPTAGHPQGPILLGMITSANAGQLQTETADREYSFADEMVATALIELGQARSRSAIIHAVIALESSSKRVLERLLEYKLHGLEKGGTVEIIAKELSVVALARLVLFHVAGEEVTQKVDWAAVQQLYDTRNTIVHKSRKRLPDFAQVKSQILEVMKYVNTLESMTASVVYGHG